ncbi:Uma2 family endonuclease [Gloeothece citriformis]|uniref:Uma2 family endonuclease n=1 Tax=Gloeothece citriformis TaxID=2546356 RepID=UPI0002F4D02A|nr:Uma2 family endonuclease [Gloeothece citriformis]
MVSTKKRIYAQENIFEYWVVDIKNKKIIVYRSPELDNYQETIELSSEAKICPLAFPELEIVIADIFKL